MNRNWVKFGFVALVVIILGWFVLKPGPNDKEQIQTALKNAIKAGKEGRPGGVMEYLSDSFRVNSVSYRPGGAQVADAIKRYKPDVTVDNTEPTINGGTATITSNIELSILTRSISVPNVTFTFKKEDAHRWLVIPTKEWKLEGVSAPQDSVDSVAAQMMF